MVRLWTILLISGAVACSVAWTVLALREKGLASLQSVRGTFRKHSRYGKAVLGFVFCGLFVLCATKPQGGGNGEQGTGNGGDGGGGDGGTNSVPQMVPGNVNVANVEMLPVPNTNAQLGNGNIGTGILHSTFSILHSNGLPVVAGTISAEDCAAGYVLSAVRTGETHSFEPPPDAVVCGDWMTFGAARDWIYENVKWKMENVKWGTGNGKWGTEDGTKLRIHSDGWAEVLPAPGTTGVPYVVFSPFKATLGIVPQANWPLILHSTFYTLHSQFWHCLTPSNTLQMTWLNALLDRDPSRPVSFQCEVSANGDVEFRYDLKNVKCKMENGECDDCVISNVLVGVSCGGGARTLGALARSVTSLRFARIDPSDAMLPDRDGDGISTVDEVFLHHTDPGNPDTDFDGLSDSDELFVWHTDPTNPHALRPDMPDGMAVKIGGENPWAYPEDSTNTIWQHVFYSGTTNGAFAYPQPTNGTAVLSVTVSGEGSGELVVGGTVVPLLAPPQMRSGTTSSTLAVPVVKGVTHPVYMRADGSLSVTFDSGQFAFGILPSASAGVWSGRINFPNTEATVPCIHDLNRCVVHVSLPLSADAGALTCAWNGTEAVEVENRPPRSAKLAGRFSPGGTSPVTYTLEHPEHVLGPSQHSQTARFCPKPDDDDEEVEPEPGMVGGEGSPDVGSWFGGGDPFGGRPGEWEEEAQWEGEGNGSGDGSLSVGEGGAGSGAVPAWEDPGTCPEHRDGYGVCSNLHEQAYASAQALQSIAGVLLLRNPPLYEPMHLDVPSGLPPPCCPCPDHNTNVVRACYVSGRLSVLDANGLAFRETAVSCDVYVGGVVPSAEVGDARLMFSRGGQICAEQRRTVFGVGISSVDGVDLAALNVFAPDFGLPVAPGTNAPAANLNLDLKTMMTHGRVRLSVEDATARFVVAYRSPYDWQWHVLADSERQPVRDMPVQQWRRLFARGRRDAFAASVAVMAAGTGTCDVKFTYWTVVDGRFAEDSAVQRITAVPPPMLSDLNRNGVRDADDVDMFVRGLPLRFWMNEDTEKGDDLLSPTGTSQPNVSDLFVNGTLDLVNFCAIALDLNAFRENWGFQNVGYRICSEYPGYPELNACLADVGWNALSAPQTGTVHSVEGDLLSAARLTRINLENPEWTLPANRLQQFQDGRGIVFAEFPQWCTGGALVLKVFMGDTEVFRSRLPLWITPARYMYRWYNGRHFSGQAESRQSMMDEPLNNPDGLENAKTLLFLHGANVSEAEAEKWGDAIFKRLWHSGFKANFINVDWRSDIGNKANYHQNASNAFEVASQIAADINAIPGEKVIMAHSLGNMVVSSMIQDYGLQVTKYLMCNSAVPAEAYDTALSPTNVLVHKDWNEYPVKARANEWYKLFENDDGDDRYKLTWSGRFADVVDYAVNFYSTDDHVLELYHNNNVWPTDGYENWNQMFERYSWHKQELWKGRSGMFFNLGTTDWSGWSIRENILGYNVIQPTNAWLMSDAELKTNTVFKLQPESMNTNSIPLLLRGAHLAKGIPARTPASGVMKWGAAFMDNQMCDLNSINVAQNGIARPNGWIIRSNGLFDDWGTRWLHSDIKDMAYFYVFKFFERVKEEAGLQ